MEWLAVLGGIVGLIVDIPLMIGILRGNIKQNFLTYLLWGLLDGIAFITILIQDGNFWLPMGYSFGAILVSILLLFKGHISWTKVETFVIVLIIICLFVWYKIGPQAGTIASVLALGVATIPQIVETYKDPKNTPVWLYFVYLLAGVLSFLGGANWNIEDKLYSIGVIIISLLIMIISLKKYEDKISILLSMESPNKILF